MAYHCDRNDKARSARLAQSGNGRIPWRDAFVATALLWGLISGGGPAWGRDKPPAETAPASASAGDGAAPSEPPAANASGRAFWSYARARFERGDYSAAAAALEQAYTREPLPVLLFNVGQAYRKASRYAEALEAYERFLKVAPAKDALALDAADYIRTLRLLMAQEQRQKQIVLAMEQTQEELQRFRKPPLYKRAWVWVTVAGAAATVVAIGVGVKLYQDQRTTDTGNLSLQ
jgi:hypothetical protein